MTLFPAMNTTIKKIENGRKGSFKYLSVGGSLSSCLLMKASYCRSDFFMNDYVLKD